MENSQAEELYQKYRRGEADAEEAAWIESWYIAECKKSKLLNEDLDYSGIEDRIWARLQEDRVVKHRRLWLRVAVAAAAVVAIVFGVWFYNSNTRLLKQVQDEVVLNDIAPGKYGATLTLIDGKKIRLSDAVNGHITGQAGVDVIKTANGQVAYQLAKRKESADQLHQVSNTLSTGRGETYMIILPDGTKVWLNAASSLKFNPQFHSRFRVVELDGEAYFEVAKDKERPFIVATDDQQVEVLGTHFNINSYRDENRTTTTLLEGSVRIASLPKGVKNQAQFAPVIGKGIILKLGQQAILSGDKLNVITANIEQAIAWKSGNFAFHKQSLQDIMRSVERWYDVEVVYEPGIENKLFTGSVSRFDNISSLLKVLELTGAVHFKIEGRRVTVMK